MISFFVPGHPKTAGSKRAFMRPGMRFPVIVDDCKKGKDWRGDVKRFAIDAYKGPLIEGPLRVRMVFTMARPKGHFRSGKHAHLLRDGARIEHASKPDVLKMARAVEDALTGIIWRDDAQIYDEHLTKLYGETPGVMVAVESLPINLAVPDPYERQAALALAQVKA
jgi:Holliday junction resolvase RusA-like endonuclease